MHLVCKYIHNSKQFKMEEQSSSGNTDSCENTVASLRRERDQLQLDVQNDLRTTMDEIARNNNRLSARLHHLFESKMTVSLTAVDRSLDHLLETKKDVESTRRRIQLFSANSAQISSSDSPVAAPSAGPRQHRITPLSVRGGLEGESGFLVDAAVVRSGSATTAVHDQLDNRGVMPVKPDAGPSDESIGGAACKLEYDAAGNADFGFGFSGTMAVEGAKRGNATRKRAKQGVDQQQAQGGKAQKPKTGAASPGSGSESVDTK